MPPCSPTLSREQVETVLAQVAEEVPGANLSEGVELMAAALQVSLSTIHRALRKFKLDWPYRLPKAADTPCSVCGQPSRARGMCDNHHRLYLKARTPEEVTQAQAKREPPAPVKFVAAQDCEATASRAHLWVLQKGTRVCFYCREPFSAVLRRRKECSTKSRKRS